MRTFLSSSAATVLLLFAASEPAGAQSAADFYRGKEVRLIIAASTGGGYDTYGRTVARHLGEHIPGKPTVVPQNMPAAGGLSATTAADGAHRRLPTDTSAPPSRSRARTPPHCSRLSLMVRRCSAAPGLAQ